MINTETQKHDKCEKLEILNNVNLLLKTSKLNLTLFIAFVYY